MRIWLCTWVLLVTSLPCFGDEKSEALRALRREPTREADSYGRPRYDLNSYLEPLRYLAENHAQEIDTGDRVLEWYLQLRGAIEPGVRHDVDEGLLPDWELRGDRKRLRDSRRKGEKEKWQDLEKWVSRFLTRNLDAENLRWALDVPWVLEESRTLLADRTIALYGVRGEPGLRLDGAMVAVNEFRGKLFGFLVTESALERRLKSGFPFSSEELDGIVRVLTAPGRFSTDIQRLAIQAVIHPRDIWIDPFFLTSLIKALPEQGNHLPPRLQKPYLEALAFRMRLLMTSYYLHPRTALQMLEPLMAVPESPWVDPFILRNLEFFQGSIAVREFVTLRLGYQVRTDDGITTLRYLDFLNHFPPSDVKPLRDIVNALLHSNHAHRDPVAVNILSQARARVSRWHTFRRKCGEWIAGELNRSLSDTRLELPVYRDPWEESP